MSIFARSPHIITIAETAQTGSKIELFLWNGTGSAPASPQYTLSKLIPATNNLITEYNVSPYVREYINWTVRQTPYNSFSASQTTQYVNVKIKRYKLASGTYTLLDTTDYKGYDGFGYYEEGFNPSLTYDILHDEGTFNYYYDGLAANVVAVRRAGFIMVRTGTSYKAQYTNLVSGATHTQALTNNSIVDVIRVYFGSGSYYSAGNKLEILDTTDNVIWTGNFKPQNNCKYDAVLCDFVNKYGCWQRTWFYAASNNTLNVESQEYNLMQTATSGYNRVEGQRQVFNNNGKKSIKVNTDWVDESYNELLRQIMLSEKIIINNYPAKLNSKSTELFKSINTKMINYTLEFEFAFDVINSVV
jgi:hypothetical protein